MPDSKFFKTPTPLTLEKLAKISEVVLPEGIDGNKKIKNVASIQEAGPEDVAFLDNPKYLPFLKQTKAGACFVSAGFANHVPSQTVRLIAETPYRAYALAATAFYPDHLPRAGHIHQSAVVADSAQIGEGTVVEAGAVIGDQVKIGKKCKISANSVIGDQVEIGDETIVGTCASLSHCLIGRHVRIYPGVRIGQDGFGFATTKKGHLRVPQLGRVIIKDHVEIGANSTVDRGAIPDTIIGEGTMIDNLVQIAHNVQIGKNCVLVSQSGVAGSATLKDNVILGGQAGVNGHITIGTGVLVGGKCGVVKSVPDGMEVAGFPAVPRRHFLRQSLFLQKMAMGKTKNTQGK